ncbi:MAG: glycogen synthase, partial [Patescibacteria group bacterium]|nr:glycogen synthase [Patescibacteria group bacterium]
MSSLKILMASPEVVPYAKTGGLADVVGALPKELEKLNVEVKILLPKYQQVDIAKLKIKDASAAFLFPVGSTMERGKLWYSNIGKNIQVLLIENDKFFDREGLYGTSAGDYPDNLKRFVFFSRGVLETLRLLEWRPDIIHCHDWQTALIPTYLKTLYKTDEFFQGIKTVFTIHNLAYQGVFPPEQFVSIGLDWEEYNPDKLEFYNKINILKAGLVYSDKLTTVSPKYSKEIQTPEFGCGLEGVLQARSADLVGILNGIDYSIWSPGKDPLLPVKYTVNQLKISNKLKVKQHLLNIHNMPVESAENVPILGSISRLADQKGYDLIAEALPMLMNMNIRLIILA